MAVYFKLRGFEHSTTVKILVAISIIIASLSVIHWGYCGVAKQFMDINHDPMYGMQGAYNQIAVLLKSVIAFSAITGILQLMTSIFILLTNLSYVGQEKRSTWNRVISATIIANLAFNFALAVITGIYYTYFKELYRTYFQNYNEYYGTYLRDWLTYMVTFVSYTLAETILTFILALPLIGIVFAAFVENSWKDESHYAFKDTAPTSKQQMIVDV